MRLKLDGPPPCGKQKGGSTNPTQHSSLPAPHFVIYVDDKQSYQLFIGVAGRGVKAEQCLECQIPSSPPMMGRTSVAGRATLTRSPIRRRDGYFLLPLIHSGELMLLELFLSF